MTRMTKFISEKIISKAIEKAGLPAERYAVKAAKYTLAEALRVESLGGPEKAASTEKLIKQIEKQLGQLPEGLLTSDSFARRDYEMYKMNLGGLRVTLRYSDSTDDLRYCQSGFTLPADHALVIRFSELDNVEADINKRESDLAHQIRAVVGSCTTVKKLLEIWPESKELIPTTLEEARPQLPAIQVADLNKLVGLPSGEQNV